MFHHDSTRTHRHDHSGHARPRDFRCCLCDWHSAQSRARAVEIAFSFLSNSLALISDGVHNFSDVLGLLLAWGAGRGLRPGSQARFADLWLPAGLYPRCPRQCGAAATGAIDIEAIRRFAEAPPVASATVIWAAGLQLSSTQRRRCCSWADENMISTSRARSCIWLGMRLCRLVW